MEIKIYSSVNEPGGYYVETAQNVLDEEDISAYALKLINSPEMENYARKYNVRGWYFPETVEIAPGVFKVVIPE